MATANDRAWQLFFEQTNTLSLIDVQGYAEVTADDLKEFGRREPRLMAKIDTLEVRPASFIENKLAILPLKNGLYLLFPDPENKSFYSFPKNFQNVQEEYWSNADLHSFETFPANKIFSESQAIDYAFMASLISHFTQTSPLNLSIRGRLSSGNFSFELASVSKTLEVSNVQVEVDAGFESPDSVILIEAKIGSRENFNVRQLFYPYHQWVNRTHKKVRTIFLTYSNSEYTLTEFAVGTVFGDLTKLSSRTFTINENPIANINLLSLLTEISVEPDRDRIPIPQADDFEKIVDLIQFVDVEKSPSEVAEYFGFTERQSDYYGSAAVHLGFVTRANQKFVLTDVGKMFLQISSRGGRTRFVLSQMLKREKIRRSFELLAARQLDFKQIKKHELAGIISDKSNLSNSTVLRRATTVKAWMSWILKNANLTLH